MRLSQGFSRGFENDDMQLFRSVPVLVRRGECQVIHDLRGLALLVDPLPPSMDSAGGGAVDQAW